MGHIILIAEELVKFFSRCPPDLLAVIEPNVPVSEWEAFVNGPLHDAKSRDMKPLAGGKPPPGQAQQSGFSSDSSGGAGSMGLGFSGQGNTAGTKEEDSDEEDEEDRVGNMKFGEPLTRSVAAGGGSFDDDAVCGQKPVSHQADGDDEVGYGRVIEETPR
jgi:SIT4-associating protein SAP185/190